MLASRAAITRVQQENCHAYDSCHHAYVLGARGVAGMSAGIGRTLLFVFLVLAVIMVIVGLVNRV